MSLLTSIVSYYKLDNAVTDSTGSFNGTAGSSLSYTTGVINNAGVFDGTANGYFEHGALSSYSFIQNTAVFSISLWIKFGSLGTSMIFGGNTLTTLEKGFFIQKLATNVLRCSLNRSVNGSPVITSDGPTIPDTNWHHLVITGDGTNIRFYLDTTLTVGSSSVFALSSGDSSRLNRFGQGNFSSVVTPLTGNLDEIGIWSKTLNSTEVSQLYNSGVGLSYPFGSSSNFLMMM